jgi:hypothetical protein
MVSGENPYLSPWNIKCTNIQKLEENNMGLTRNTKAVSIIVLILLMIISAIMGGLIAYMFTIPPYMEIPAGTHLNITDVYIDKENAKSFKISVLNPSYSTKDTWVTGIAVNLQNETTLYDVVETEPVIGEGIAVSKGASVNITCSKIRRGSVNSTWGTFVAENPGKTITVNVFAFDTPAANEKVTLPYVKLNVIGTEFNPRASFKKFNITMTNDPVSEVNFTVSEILVAGVDLTGVFPTLPQKITKNPLEFAFNGSWHGLTKTTLTVFTEEGYTFSNDIDLSQAYAVIKNVTINEDYTDHFNVTLLNLAESANYVNVTKITCTLENGTAITRNYDPPIGMIPNSTRTFTINEDWREYRAKKLNVTAYFLQDFETDTFQTTTPQPIIVKVVNQDKVFDLRDREHFNITLANHPSSLRSINITQILVKQTGELINGTKASPQLPYGLITPGQSQTFYCNITDWTGRAGGTLNLTVYVTTTLAQEQYSFEFKFTMPAAELNITNVNHTTISGTQYLNITIENLGFSAWNITVSKVTITLQGQTQPPIQNQITIPIDGKVVLLVLFSWEGHLGQNITITVSSIEGIEASWQGSNW